MTYVGQNTIIDNINRQLKKDKLPSGLKFKKAGVCNGLSNVYAFYALQGREDDFKAILNIIAKGDFEHASIAQDELYQFAHRVLIAQNPGEYLQHLDQPRAMETLKIGNQPIKSIFDFALATSKDNWAEVIKKINLEENEVMLVSSADHAVAVRKENNGYTVYDPNYAKGFKTFKNASALVKELHQNVFEYFMFGNLGLSVSVVRDPEATARSHPLPNLCALYQNHLNPKKTTATIIRDLFKLTTFNTLIAAIATTHDKDAIDYLLNNIKLTAKEEHRAAIMTVFYNNTEALKLLTPIIAKQDDSERSKMKGLFLHSLKKGRFEAFKVLEDKFQDCFKDWNSALLIEYAAQGGNPTLLQTLIANVESHYDTQPSHFFAQEIWEEITKQKERLETGFHKEFDAMLKSRMMSLRLRQAIPEAIKSGSPACVDILLKKFHEYNGQLSDQEKIDYLLLAITHNKVQVVNHLIHQNPKMSKELLATISLSTLAVYRTELNVLNALERCGVQFSAQALNIISQKRDNQWLKAKTVLDLLLSYLSNFLGQNQIAYEDKLREYKRKNCILMLQKFKNNCEGHESEETKNKLEGLIEQYQQQVDSAKDLNDLDKILTELKKKEVEFIPIVSLELDDSMGSNSKEEEDDIERLEDELNDLKERFNAEQLPEQYHQSALELEAIEEQLATLPNSNEPIPVYDMSELGIENVGLTVETAKNNSRIGEMSSSLENETIEKPKRYSCVRNQQSFWENKKKHSSLENKSDDKIKADNTETPKNNKP